MSNSSLPPPPFLASRVPSSRLAERPGRDFLKILQRARAQTRILVQPPRSPLGARIAPTGRRGKGAIMSASITLWECPPLRARITRQQCGHNRARAASGCSVRSALMKLDDLPLGPSECLRCPGVDWWAEHGRPPREVLSVELIREHREK